MNKRLITHFLILLTIGFVGCAKKSQKKAVVLKITTGVQGLAGAGYAAGGAMPYGHNDRGHAFAHRLDFAGEVPLQLDNGFWQFSLVAWNGITNQLSGNSVCAFNIATIKGEDLKEPISLNLSPEACERLDNDDWTARTPIKNIGNYEAQKFSNLELTSCRTLVGIVKGSGIGSTACNNVDVGKSAIVAYKVLLVPFKLQSDLKIIHKNTSALTTSERPIYSKCFPVNTADNNADVAFSSTSINLPIRNGMNTPFYTVVRGYYAATDCNDSDSRGYKDFDFPKGLLNPPSDAKTYQFSSVNVGSKALVPRVFLRTFDSEVCKSPRNSLTSRFASGTGDAGLPFGICNSKQFNMIGDNFLNYKDSHLSLHNNITFLVNPNTGNSIFNPIGDEDLDSTAVNIFTGNFYGNGHYLSNIFQFGITDSNSHGIFRLVAGNVKINNLTIKNFAIECSTSSGGCQEMGILIGKVDNKDSPLLIDNVKVHGYVSGGDYIGSLIGNIGSHFIINNVHGNAFVDGTGYVGGLIGSASSFNSTTLLSQSSFKGNIWGNNGESTTGRAGGLIGKFNSSGKILESLSLGSVHGYQFIGGLVGEMSGGEIKYSYSKMSVTGSGYEFSDVNIGGLVGYLDSGNSILQNNFHTLGHIANHGSQSLDAVGGGSRA